MDEVQQGDIYADIPSVVVATRPLQVARNFVPKNGRVITSVHDEAHPPADGFRWGEDQNGEEAFLVHAQVGLAMVLSNDCEIENDPNVRILAAVRSAAVLNSPWHEGLFSGQEDQIQYGIFPLEAQATEPTFERSFVDFRHITTVRAGFLDNSNRIASVSEELRELVAQAFQAYLFRRV